MAIRGTLDDHMPILASPPITHANELCLVIEGVAEGIKYQDTNYWLILSLYNNENMQTPDSMLGYFKFDEDEEFNVSVTIPQGIHRVLFGVKWNYLCSMEIPRINAYDGPCNQDC